MFDARPDKAENGHQKHERAEGDQKYRSGAEQARLILDDEVNYLQDILIDKQPDADSQYSESSQLQTHTHAAL